MEQRIELGVCQATLIGALVDEPKIINHDKAGRPVISTTMSVARPAKGNPNQGGRRQRWENLFEVTASGTAADNIMRNYHQGRRACIMGELTVGEGSVSVHAAQLHWLDGHGSL